MPAVALTDTNGLYAAVQFYKLAQEAKVKPIVGVTLDAESVPPSFRAQREISPILSRHSPLVTRHSTSIVLLAADMEGYSNLCQLVTLRHLGTTKLSQNMNPAETDGRPLTLQELAEHSRGVIALCPLPARSPDVGARRGAACCAPTKKTQANSDCCEQGISATNHESPVTSHHLPITFHNSRRFSAIACTSRCSASRRETGACCAKRNASAANCVCHW